MSDTFSVEQLQKMKHALGLTRIDKPNESYRNYYNTDEDADWEDLVTRGYAERQGVNGYAGSFIYRVSERGKELLKQIIGNFKEVD